MKTRLLYIFLSIASLPLFAMPSEMTKVDSLCENLKGTWYKVLNCDGFNGEIRTIYMGDTLEIERIQGTDSLILTKFKNGLPNYIRRTVVSYFDTEFEGWILTSSFFKVSTQKEFKSYWIIWYENDLFGISDYNVSDAGGYGYARKQLVTAISNPALSTGIQAFPNPTSGSLQLSETIVGPVQILDASGRVLKRFNATQPTRTVDFTPLTSGLYFLQIEAKGKPTTLKIQKK